MDEAINNDVDPSPLLGPAPARGMSRGMSKRLRLAVTSVGFFADSYDNFIINMVLVVMKERFHATAHDLSYLAAIALAGNMIGMIIFGIYGDRYHRTSAWLFTTTLVIVGAAGSAFAIPVGKLSLMGVLGLWRFLVGLGIGGEYPLTATIASDDSTDEGRGRHVATVFLAQGVGVLAAPLVMLVLVATLPGDDLQYSWRVALGIGGLVPLLSAYHRYKMFKEDRSRDNQPFSGFLAAVDGDTLGSNWLTLMGTCGSWFLLDATFYGNGLFAPTVLQLLQLNKDKSMHNLIMAVAEQNALVAAMSVPGYFMAIFLIDRWGRRYLQLLGFFLVSITFLIMGVFYDFFVTYPMLFFITYGATFCFSNLGPNTTTFVIPSEVFPKAVSAKYHGVSAACGKLGGVFGAILMPFVLESFGPQWVMLGSAFIGYVAVCWTFIFVPETMGRSRAHAYRAKAVSR